MSRRDHCFLQSCCVSGGSLLGILLEFGVGWDVFISLFFCTQSECSPYTSVVLM